MRLATFTTDLLLFPLESMALS